MVITMPTNKEIAESCYPKWTKVEKTGRRYGGNLVYLCRCESCGYERDISSSNIKHTMCPQCGSGQVKGNPLEVLRLNTQRSNHGCLEFSGCRNDEGYGIIGVKGKMKMAHRFVWELAHGEIPTGMRILHKCDNPSCVDLSHLFIGTDGDNVTDKTFKGRQAKGETHPQARLSEDEVREMRRLLKIGESQREVAAKFGVTRATAWRISSRFHWKHI
jgi:predicted Zn-ribbon and HTH transcriptional regulator